MEPNLANSPLQDPQPAADSPGSGENLALFYQGLLTGVVRLKGQRQHLPDSETFRRRTKATLQEVERVAVNSGYDLEDVRDTHFAVVAFLDSVVLNSKDPVRAEWERKTLQEELFGKTDAGVVFFEKLDRFCARRDSEQLADIFEVYLLCLLLGFEGRYSGGARGDLHSTSEILRTRIERIRGREESISPSAKLLPDSTAALSPVVRRNYLRLAALSAMIFTILCFCVLKLNLIWASTDLAHKLQTVF